MDLIFRKPNVGQSFNCPTYEIVKWSGNPMWSVYRYDITNTLLRDESGMNDLTFNQCCLLIMTDIELSANEPEGDNTYDLAISKFQDDMDWVIAYLGPISIELLIELRLQLEIGDV